METLEINLNEIVSKQIKEQIEQLKSELKSSYDKNREQSKIIKALKIDNAKSKTAIWLIDNLRKSFSEITKGESDSGGWYDSKDKNRFVFIEKILSKLFGIQKEANGWYSSRDYGTLHVHLAVNYYNNKEIVINLLRAIMEDNERTISFIESFVMPSDYNKDLVLKYVTNPQYNTNGAIFGISNFWIENGAGMSNLPHDLIMKNDHILEDDIFGELVKYIKRKGSYYYYLFALPKYNKNISKEQIQILGECLIDIPLSILQYDVLMSFMGSNLHGFNETTLDYLYGLINGSNPFNTLHWEKFPSRYQMKYLMNMDIEMVLKTLTNYSCKWTSEEKRKFFVEYSSK